MVKQNLFQLSKKPQKKQAVRTINKVSGNKKFLSTADRGIILKVLPQITQTKEGRQYLKSPKRDRGRVAMPAGKRISKSGKEYWETRVNRSDAMGSRI